MCVLQKVQRNGLAVDLEDDLKPAEAQNQNLSESPDLDGGKNDKVYKHTISQSFGDGAHTHTHNYNF